MEQSDNALVSIDADGHVIEPNEVFEEYVEPAYRDRAPRLRPNDDDKMRFFFDGLGHPPFPAPVSIRKPMSAENRIKILDKERIQAALLFPSGGLLVPWLEDGALSLAIARGYNDWLADYRRPFPDRLLAVGLLPLHDIDAAVEEARRVVANGAVALVIRPNPCPNPSANLSSGESRGNTLDDPAYDPLYAAIEELGVPLVVHEATGCPDTAAGDRYGIWNPERYTFNHVISHPFEQMFAALSIICGGVLERFPRLRVGFFEAGCSWVPYWLSRLDDHFGHRSMRKQMPNITMKPSDYFHRQCVVSCDPGDRTLPLAIAGLGADKILFASDYPHFDSGAGPVGEFLAVPNISSEDQGKILWHNAAEFFNLRVPSPL